MRRLLLCSLPFALGGCSLMPSHDPSQAWVDLSSKLEKDNLQALRVDAKPLEDDRFFQVSPGKHELQMRFQFAVDPSNIGPQSEAMPRTCLMTLDYAEFSAGERYRLEAGSYGFRPWVQLYDERGQRVAKAKEGRCGEV
ncbi:hypothetical protein [Pseudomonas sp. LRF_L74]|uniref:PA0061/PA0062 family lipoprotein n=1 Tax=Pseudomonas sp. LRF_L74 TaxID=3369422 RepID=UPI003F63B32A